MVNKSKLLEDLTKLAGCIADNTVNKVSEAKKHISDLSKHKIEDLISDYKLVKREEFEILRKLLQKSIMAQEKLEKRIKILEKKVKSKQSLKKVPKV